MAILLTLAAVDLAGRIATLLYQMGHSEVRCLQYRTWVLLVAFVNFAFVFYWLLGWVRGAAKPAQTSADTQMHNQNEQN